MSQAASAFITTYVATWEFIMQTNDAFEKAVRLHQSGQTATAEAIYTKILAARPNHPGALHMLGVLRQQHSDGTPRRRGFDRPRPSARNPANHVFHNNYGAVLHALGRHQEAAAEFAQALALSPNYADALANQGMAMMSLGHDTAALASLGRALQLQPAHGDALRRAAALLKKYGRAGEAVPLFERAIALAASDNGRSGVKPLGKSGGTPLLHSARLHLDFGELLVGLSSRDRAIEQYRRALELSPDLAEAHFDLGSALVAQGKVEEAEGHLRRAVELRPDSAAMHSNWVYCHQYRAGVTPEVLAAAHAEWDRRHGAPLRNVSHDPCRMREAKPLEDGALRTERSNEFTATPPEDGFVQRTTISEVPCSTHPAGEQPRTLRLGFVSRHFRQHPVGCMTVRAIECLKELRTKPGATRPLPGPPPHPLAGSLPVGEGEIYCYSDTPRRDAITERFIAAADCWRDTEKLSDDALAEQIRGDRIDILFDLGGHLGGNRLLLFARKPAPVQVKWRGELRGRMARSPLCDGPRFAEHLIEALRGIGR